MLFTYTKTQEFSVPVRYRNGCGKAPCQATRKTRVKYLALEVFELPCLMLGVESDKGCDDCPALPDKPQTLWTQAYNAFMTFSLYLRMNIGGALFLLAALWLGSQYYATFQQKQDYLQTPNINDFYFVDINYWKPDNHPFYRYTALKVVAIHGDQVEVQIGNMMHDKQVSAREQISYDKALYRGFFTRKTMMIPISQLTELYDQDVIYDVRRPRNLFIDGSVVVRQAIPDETSKDNP